MSSVNSEASILGDGLAERDTLIDQFVDTTAEARSGRSSAAPSKIEAILPDSGGSLSLSIVTSPRAVEAEWKALEERAAISPYQRLDLAAAWLDHGAAPEGVEARIGVVRDETGRVVMILPFGVVRQFGISIAVYLGGSHFNLNLPLADPNLRLGKRAAGVLLDAYAEMTNADLVLLRNQPKVWKGTPHPFLFLPHYGAPDDVRLIIIDSDFDSYLLRQLSRKMRSQLRRKTTRFKDAGILGATRAETPEEVERYLTAFFEQKSKRLASQGLDDPFALPGVKDFLRAATLHGLAGDGGLELRAIMRGGQILSVRAGVRHRDHHSLMVQSFDTEHILAKHSPGEYLLTEVLLAGRMQGVTSFDFGVGDGRFKQVWSNEAVPMFNIAHGLTKRGHMLAGLIKSKDAAKRYIKRNPRLFSMVQDARVLGAKLRGVAGLLFFAQ
jgi:CelD/BcsL family acetyltransferase involved in cellulose biosynthesis